MWSKIGACEALSCPPRGSETAERKFSLLAMTLMLGIFHSERERAQSTSCRLLVAEDKVGALMAGGEALARFPTPRTSPPIEYFPTLPRKAKEDTCEKGVWSKLDDKRAPKFTEVGLGAEGGGGGRGEKGSEGDWGTLRYKEYLGRNSY
eukprot:1018138-Rhodomonas_salina.2